MGKRDWAAELDERYPSGACFESQVAAYIRELEATIDTAMVLAKRGDSHGRIVHALKYAATRGGAHG